MQMEIVVFIFVFLHSNTLYISCLNCNLRDSSGKDLSLSFGVDKLSYVWIN